MKTQDYLISIGTCQKAKDWVGEKTLQQAWDECTKLDWMFCLLDKNFKNEKWPSKKEIGILILDCIIKTRPDKKEECLAIKEDLCFYIDLSFYLDISRGFCYGLCLYIMNFDPNLGLNCLKFDLTFSSALKEEILNSFHSLTLPIKDIK